MIAIVACSLGLAQVPAAQTDTDLVFRSEVRRVLVDVFVTVNGRPLGGLSAEAFEVFDKGIRQENVTLVGAEQLPLGAALVLDTSGSVQGDELNELRAAANTFVDALGPPDSVAILTFGTRYRLLQPFTRDLVAAKSALDGARGFGATSLFDSLLFAFVYIEQAPGRPLIVLLSDGLDTASWLSSADLVESAERSEAVVFAVRTSSSSGATERTDHENPVESYHDRLGTEVLESIVSTTAGRVLSLEPRDDIASAFQQVLREMRNRYVLSYEPVDASEGWHELEVRLPHEPDAELRARRGYYFR